MRRFSCTRGSCEDDEEDKGASEEGGGRFGSDASVEYEDENDAGQ